MSRTSGVRLCTPNCAAVVWVGLSIPGKRYHCPVSCDLRKSSLNEGGIMEIDRRDFLKTTGKAVTVGAATLALGGRVLGANDRVRLAICGLRGRGNDHLKGFAKVPGTEIAGMCDVDE